MTPDPITDLLRCPFCGTRLDVVENDALVREGDRIVSGVIGCECCVFPIVDGIPVMIADDTTREAMHALEAGRVEDARLTLLGLTGERADAFRRLLARGDGMTYRDALDVLSPDPEGTYFIYRFSDPTYIVSHAIVQALSQRQWPLAGRVLDLCGGCGHVTRALTALRPAGGTVLADVYFWKLWLAKRCTAPDAAAVCCDANHPLPFARDTFSTVLLLDAFPYIWHRRMLADEMMRVAGSAGVVMLPHLHSSLGENFAAGMALTPAAYLDLFAPQKPRLFSDTALFAQVVEEARVDLGENASAETIGAESSVTLIASPRADLFGEYPVRPLLDVTGEMRVNPLYAVERRNGASVLTLTFPTPEYEEEFGECRRYLPETLTLDADLTGPLTPAMFGERYEELRRRRILLDLPPNYI